MSTAKEVKEHGKNAKTFCRHCKRLKPIGDQRKFWLRDEYPESINKKLAVYKGICPFPNDCNKRKTCTKDDCSADTCSNGYAYRFS